VDAPSVPLRAGPAEGHPRGPLPVPRVPGHRPGQAAAVPEAGREAGPDAPAPPGPRPEAAQGAHPGLHDRLQADPDQQRLLPGRRGTQCRARDRGHRGDPAARDRHQGRRRAADGHDRAGHRLPRDRPADRGEDLRPRRSLPGRRLGQGHGQQQERGRRGLPEHVPAGRPERRRRPHVDGLHDRVAGRLRRRRPPDDGGRGARGPRDDARGAGGLALPDSREVEGHRLDEHGHNTTLWPDFTFRFRKLTKKLDRENYVGVPAGTERPEVAA
jgi:hypothetical protein